MNDVAACLAKTHLGCGDLAFNLRLSDPIERLLDADARWRGAAGEYVVTVGEESKAKRGARKTLPTLAASVNAFTRLWLGVLPATTLAATDELAGDAKLLARLDEAFLLPAPHMQWFF